ncbi:MAG: hypothetical protein GX890_06260 [Firmicutes bacterium]|jgi:hypothetical protein|nr:hypothetical protein [Bacillota bacterium]HPU01781.1 hypothetical protein [Bacillota bacterium]
MSNGAAAAAAIAQAIKASGAIVRVLPEDFRRIVDKVEQPLVVVSVGRFLGTTYHYLTSYKGLIFYTRSREQLLLKGSTEYVHARSIYIPQ